MANHGFYTPRYPQKYLGDPENIQFRSSWEAAFMQFADLNPNIMQWRLRRNSYSIHKAN